MSAPAGGEELLAELPDEYRDAFLELAALASAAHDHFAFRDETSRRAFYEELFRRGGADFAPPAGRLCLMNGRPAGLVALVPPAARKRSRLIGAMMLARSALLRDDPALVRRLQLAAGAFAHPLDSDAYLSRLAVHADFAGRGLGRRLLQAALDETRRLGLERCVLEVADTNERAIALYLAAGFVEIGRGSAAKPESGAGLGYLHLAWTA